MHDPNEPATAAAILSIRQHGPWQYLPLDFRALAKLGGGCTVLFDGPPFTLCNHAANWHLEAEESFHEALSLSFRTATYLTPDSALFKVIKSIFNLKAVRAELARMLDLTLTVLVTDTAGQAIRANSPDTVDAIMTLRCDALLALIMRYRRQDPQDLQDWLSSLLHPAVRATLSQLMMASTSYRQVAIDAIPLPSEGMTRHAPAPGRLGQPDQVFRMHTFATLFPTTPAPSALRTKCLKFSGVSRPRMPTPERSCYHNPIETSTLVDSSPRMPKKARYN